MAQWHEFMVDLCTDTMASEEGMYREGKVEGRTSCRHSLYLSLWCEYEYLRGKEVEFYCVEEVHGVWLRVVEYFLNGV